MIKYTKWSSIYSIDIFQSKDIFGLAYGQHGLNIYSSLDLQKFNTRNVVVGCLVWLLPLDLHTIDSKAYSNQFPSYQNKSSAHILFAVLGILRIFWVDTGLICWLFTLVSLNITSPTNKQKNEKNNIQCLFVSFQLPISVYYESLCPDSARFIVEQLHPVKSGPLGRFLEVTLIPFGKASVSIIWQANWMHYFCTHKSTQ